LVSRLLAMLELSPRPSQSQFWRKTLVRKNGEISGPREAQWHVVIWIEMDSSPKQKGQL
jgi:hypothetical protein